jgi:hypothetical protein
MRFGGSEWESNPPVTGNLPPAGFEDRDDHRTACASRNLPQIDKELCGYLLNALRVYRFHPCYSVAEKYALVATAAKKLSCSAG